MEINLVTEALKFMVLGMVIVYLFLGLMVYILKLQAYLIEKYFPEKEESKPAGWQPKKVIDNSEEEEVAAIIAAIKFHKKRG